MNLNLEGWLKSGGTLLTSGTTGKPKQIFQSPEKIRAANIAAIDSQELTKNSRVYTVCKTQHAGGLLAQTLPAYSIGAEIVIEDFNAYRFIKEIHKYTHTHITPKHAYAIRKTKGFNEIDFNGIWITCGSDPVGWDIINDFVFRGARFMTNWGMSEIGPCAINTAFRHVRDIPLYYDQRLGELTLMGSRFYCDHKIVDGQLYVKGDICVYDDWFATGDLVEKNKNGDYYYVGRI